MLVLLYQTHKKSQVCGKEISITRTVDDLMVETVVVFKLEVLQWNSRKAQQW